MPPDEVSFYLFYILQHRLHENITESGGNEGGGGAVQRLGGDGAVEGAALQALSALQEARGEGTLLYIRVCLHRLFIFSFFALFS